MAKKKLATDVENFYISFSDMLTLLVIFFVWMYSLSTVDVSKFIEQSESLKESLNPNAKQVPDMKTAVEAVKEQKNQLHEMQEQVQKFIEDFSLQEAVSVSFEKDQLELNLGEAVLFDSGRAEMKPAARPLMHKIGALLKKNSSIIRLEGHTDDVAIHTAMFKSNWELSAARAAAVAHFLEAIGISPSRMMITGYGEFQPLVPNADAQSRAKNRRVRIVLRVDSEKIMRDIQEKKEV